MAEKLNLPIMTICSTCQGVMSQAIHRMKNNPEHVARVNTYLAEEGLQYQGQVVVKHMLWIIVEEVGMEVFKRFIRKPLTGLHIAPFYGCYIVRPSDALGLKENPQRETALETVIEAVGARAVDFPGKTRCCGFPILTINEDNSVAMVAKHTIDAKGRGADAMVTPCPLCHLNLDGYQPSAAAKAEHPIDMPILHLPQMIGLAMGINPKDLGLQRHIISTKSLLNKISKVAVRA
jgi:succinate dehydrogenase / fumarate reductase cytochrome b subunit